MPFLNLNSAWSNLDRYYNNVNNNDNFIGGVNNPNVTNTQKPKPPRTKFSAFDDGFIRGGVLNVGLASARDTVRIGNFLKSPKGLIWVAKQVGLQRSSPRLETPEGFNALSNQNTRLYNLGINTLLQVPINALGGHIIRHGILPVGGVGFLEGDSKSNVKGYNYENIALANDKNGRNRLIQYFNKVKEEFPNDVTPILLNEYNGGAKSVYGIGKTEIYTTGIRTDYKNDIPDNVSSNTFTFLTYEGLDKWFKLYDDNAQKGGPPVSATSLTTFSSGKQGSKDLDFSVFQGVTGSLFRGGINPIDDYSIENIQSRIGVSTSKYGPNNIKTNYKVDSINAIDVTEGVVFYKNHFDKKTSSNMLGKKLKDKVDGYYGRDIINFRFEFLDNDNPKLVNLINTDLLAFRAYIDDFNDGMQAKWNPYRYMGRGEEFYVYEGFTRDISIAFTIHAHSPEEMKPIYRKLNYLLSTFAPDYNKANRMRGNIGYLTVGDYLYRQPGVFTDIKLTGMLDAHWEIALTSPEKGIDTDQYELPKYIKAALSFKPIHTFLPRKVQSGKYADTPFITIDKNAYPDHISKDSSGIAKNKYLDD